MRSAAQNRAIAIAPGSVETPVPLDADFLQGRIAPLSRENASADETARLIAFPMSSDAAQIVATLAADACMAL